MERLSPPSALAPARPRAGFASWALLLSAWLALAGCSADKKEPPRSRPPAPVLVAAAVVKDVPLQVKAIGKVEPSATVSLKARVTGQIHKVHFSEGAVVKKGDLLFTIDPRPFEVALKEAQARLARDQALAKQAQEDLRRYEGLIERKVVSPAQYEQYHTDAQAKRAASEASLAAVENAKLNLSFCFITAPFGGPTGSLLAFEGNMIKANDDNKSLVVIQQIEPSMVAFSLAERHLAPLRARLAQGKLSVQAVTPGQEDKPLVGELVFIDNAVDQATGTIKLKASFPNRDQRLWPAQYVNVVLTMGEVKGAVVVPPQAVQSGQIGDYLFVILPDQTAEVRKVALGPRTETEAIIAEGLKPGEQVVTDGHLRLMPGAKVEIKQGLGPAPAPKS